MKLRGLALLGLAVALAGCEGTARTGVAATAVPMPVNEDALETPNSLPPSMITTPIAPVTDVVGVTHLPP